MLKINVIKFGSLISKAVRPKYLYIGLFIRNMYVIIVRTLLFKPHAHTKYKETLE